MKQKLGSTQKWPAYHKGTEKCVQLAQIFPFHNKREGSFKNLEQFILIEVSKYQTESNGSFMSFNTQNAV